MDLVLQHPFYRLDACVFLYTFLTFCSQVCKKHFTSSWCILQFFTNNDTFPASNDSNSLKIVWSHVTCRFYEVLRASGRAGPVPRHLGNLEEAGKFSVFWSASSSFSSFYPRLLLLPPPYLRRPGWLCALYSIAFNPCISFYNSFYSHHNAARFLLQIRSYPSSFLQAQNLGCQRATAAICPQGASILIKRSYAIANSGS